MKANEAPEKLYLFEGEPILSARSKKREDVNIEYTRTDAFIEKACDAYCAVCGIKECQGCAECSWVIKFRRQLIKIL